MHTKPNNKYKEPFAEVISFHREEAKARIVLKFVLFPHLPIAPASLFTSADAPATIDLHKQITTDGNKSTFDSYDVGDIELKIGDIYIVRPWWTPHQLEIAQNPETISWKRIKFTPSDALEVQTQKGYRAQRKLEPGEIPKEGRIIPNGWEHEHCSLCWGTISSLPDEENYGYTDGNDWICDQCYSKYIASGLGQKLG